MRIDMLSVPDTSQKNRSKEKLESFCDEILNLDPRIRFVGIIHDNKKLLVENKRNGLKILSIRKTFEVLLMETALGVRMHREHNASLESVHFIVSCGQNMMLMIFSLGVKILYVSTKKDLDFFKISFLILLLLETKITKD